ncbi:hypothetical protein ACFU8A_40970, partial [Streptomyces sp. NPDC057546]|uniref:hypothetical protein n=1 Tax=Streptomyces sp. NPDC057546 TaxID=3346165 RepID=UPI003675885B
METAGQGQRGNGLRSGPETARETGDGGTRGGEAPQVTQTARTANVQAGEQHEYSKEMRPRGRTGIR